MLFDGYLSSLDVDPSAGLLPRTLLIIGRRTHAAYSPGAGKPSVGHPHTMLAIYRAKSVRCFGPSQNEVPPGVVGQTASAVTSHLQARQIRNRRKLLIS